MDRWNFRHHSGAVFKEKHFYYFLIAFFKKTNEWESARWNNVLVTYACDTPVPCIDPNTITANNRNNNDYVALKQRNVFLRSTWRAIFEILFLPF
jgi:hypothetical protein